MEKKHNHVEGVSTHSEPPQHDLEQRKPSLEDHIQLSNEHHAYLMRRHGTIELDPVPEMSDADPYNWPMRKVRHLSVKRQS